MAYANARILNMQNNCIHLQVLKRKNLSTDYVQWTAKRINEQLTFFHPRTNRFQFSIKAGGKQQLEHSNASVTGPIFWSKYCAMNPELIKDQYCFRTGALNWMQLIGKTENIVDDFRKWRVDFIVQRRWIVKELLLINGNCFIQKLEGNLRFPNSTVYYRWW